MKTIVTICITLLLAGSLWADDLTRAVQQRLKDQGFFYGSVDGQDGGETSAAIRRYQIRHGLHVTGQLNDETMRSLGVARNTPPPPAPSGELRDGSGDQDFAPPSNGRSVQPPPNGYDYDQNTRQLPAQRPNFRATSYVELFARTPYEGAPRQLQENVLFAIQGELSKKGYFHSYMDGRPSRETSEAVARFQRDEDLPMTGLLDFQTLNALQALPGQRNGPPPDEGEIVPHGPGGERVYRGIQVD
jgi:peptidoglycan hydrolase-like protein with peptidoglycan-binding domain